MSHPGLVLRLSKLNRGKREVVTGERKNRCGLGTVVAPPGLEDREPRVVHVGGSGRKVTL